MPFATASPDLGKPSSGLTTIEPGVFARCTHLESIAIPDGVTKIGTGAFIGCISISSIVIPPAVRGYRQDCVWGLCSLVYVELSAVLERIGENAFRSCTSLIAVADLSTGVCQMRGKPLPPLVPLVVGKGAFYKCTRLGSVAFPRGVSVIGASCFEGCSALTSIILFPWLKEIGTSAFEGCTSLSSVQIPGRVSEIGDRAFMWCTALADLTFMDNPEGTRPECLIGERAFMFCTCLRELIIPGNVTRIGPRAVAECSLVRIEVPGTSVAVPPGLCQGCTSLEEAVLGEGIRLIGDEAFYCCELLARVTFPRSLGFVGSGAFEDVHPGVGPGRRLHQGQRL